MPKIRSFLVVSIIVSFFIGSLSGLLSSLLVFNWLSFSGTQSFFKSGGLLKTMVNAVREDAISTDLPVLKSDSEKMVEVVKRSSPAVVSIIVTKDLTLSKQLTVLPFVENNFDFPPDLKLVQPGQPTQDNNSNKQQVGGGSGFIIRSNGLIITNKHVVSDADAEYTVVTNDGKRYPAIVLAKDQFLDIALLKIETKNLPVLTLGNSDNLEIGQTVVAIGNTLGQFQNTVTSGIVSGIKRHVVVGDGLGGSEVIEAAIQTDAPINPGNSGGPLLNLQGEVVGINTAVNLGSQSVGFALPINSIKTIVGSVEKYGHIVRPWLGVRYILLNKAMAEKNNLSLDYGALLLRGEQDADVAVVSGSPADKVGIVENDIILEVNGQKVSEDNSLGTIVNRYQVGQEITLKVWHKGEIKSIKIKLEEAISK